MSDDYDDDYNYDDEYNYDTEGGREDTKNSSTTDAKTGNLEENSFENGTYTGVTGKRLESNKNVVQNKRPRCEAPNHRKYAPAIFTLEFSGHPKYGTKKVDLCQTCYLSIFIVETSGHIINLLRIYKRFITLNINVSICINLLCYFLTSIRA